ncbi:MAG TPA: T9SS type A sorting domain-containing protein, partial [Bacteroidia bacterium]|nr:T9SS type A sorting domain-containing protein [Bacteroidia bacterium]
GYLGLNTQFDYCLALGVKPKINYADPEVVFIGGQTMAWDNYGFSSPPSFPNAFNWALTHADYHSVAFNPASSTQMMLGTDGGIFTGTLNYNSNLTTLASITWNAANNHYCTTQLNFSAINQNPNAANQCISGMQDNGTWIYTNNVYQTPIPNSGDGYDCALDMNGSQYYTVNGRYYRQDVGGGAAVDITPGSSVLNIDGAGAVYYPSLFVLDQSNPDSKHQNAIYLAAFSLDNYYSYLVTTPDASNISANPWTVLNTASPLSSPHFGGGTITAMAMSPGSYSTAGVYNFSKVLYVGTSDGSIYRITDPQNYFGLLSSQLIKQPVTGDGSISSIAVDPGNVNSLMFTESNYNSLTGIGYTTDPYDANPVWYNETGSLSKLSIRSCAIAEGPSGPEYFVGTSAGLWSLSAMPTYSIPGGPYWSQEGFQPIGWAIVNSLSYRPADNTLLVGTHGDGMFWGALGTSSRLTGIQGDGNKNQINELNIYPVPAAKAELTVNLNMVSGRKTNIQIWDASGKQVNSFEQELNTGSNTFKLPVSDLAPGTYFLKVESMPAKKFILL